MYLCTLKLNLRKYNGNPKHYPIYTTTTGVKCCSNYRYIRFVSIKLRNNFLHCN